MSPSAVHAALSNAAIYFLAVSGLWGLAGFFLRQGVTPMYRGILAIGELLLITLAIAGLAILVNGGRPGALHFLYAALGIFALPAVFAFTRGHGGRREALLYALVSLVMIGFIIRAGQTGK